MDEKLFAVLVGVIAGAVGYWFTTFCMRPILRYTELRSQAFADLILYAQVINADGLNERMRKLYEERIFANRRLSSELSACLLELPSWYRYWLRFCKQSPEKAASNLLGLSNTTEYEAAELRVEKIKKALRIPSELV